MGTSNYNLPKILGSASAKIPRDFNALADAIDEVLKSESQSNASAMSTLQSALTAINDAALAEKTILRTNKASQSLIVENPSLISKPNSGSYNLMQSQDLTSTNWFQKSGVTIGDKIVRNNIELTKFTTTNYYNSLTTRTKVANVAYPLTLDPSKKYLCSAYCMTYDTPRFFYRKSASTGINEAVFVDNQLRRFWFVVDGGINEIYWYQQGDSGYGVTGTSYTTNIYMGGFQIEEITAVKNGIAFMGDSTVQGSAGTNDVMKNTEWVKMSGSILNAPFYNRGIGGNTTANMIARWATDITPLASVCKYVVILGGINDLGKVGTTAQTILDAHRQMHNLAIADGLIPIHCNITPCNKTGTDEQIRKDANTLLKTEYGSLLLDLDTVTSDIYESNKLLQIDNWKGDGVHYAQLAKDAVAQFIVSRKFWDLIKPSVFKLYA